MHQLGKYKIRGILGKGAMGVVYEGFDPVIERTVAIKTILPSQLDGVQYAEVMTRFRREAQAAGRLNHPGIVAIYDYGEEVPLEFDSDGTTMAAPGPETKPAERVAYIAMEFVKGRELRDYFDGGERFTLELVTRMMGEMLDALDHAHAQGVVHRDMKPANLIVLDNGHVKIADFGIAHIDKSNLTRTGTLLGTPAYMSPEQFMGHGVDARSDLFSCGVILYQLLTGEKPFPGDSTTTIMYKVLREEPVPPSQINFALPPALDAIVKTALAKNPNNRFQTGKEFARALEAAVNVHSPEASVAHTPAPAQAAAVQTAGVRAGPQAPVSQAPADSLAAMQPAASRTPANRNGLWIAVLAGIAVASGGLGYMGWRSKAAADEGARQAQQMAADNGRRAAEAAAAAAAADPAKGDDATAERERAEVAQAQQALARAIEQEEAQIKTARR